MPWRALQIRACTQDLNCIICNFCTGLKVTKLNSVTKKMVDCRTSSKWSFKVSNIYFKTSSFFIISQIHFWSGSIRSLVFSHVKVLFIFGNMRFNPVLCPNAVIVGPFCVIRKVCCTLLSPSSKICVLSYPSLHLCTLLSLKKKNIVYVFQYFLKHWVYVFIKSYNCQFC